MAECARCGFHRSEWKCGSCQTPYCGSKCYDDFSTHKNHCELIAFEGKRKRDAERRGEDEPCVNETDPVHGMPFEGMDPKMIVYIGSYCFHLPSLYKRIFHDGYRINPQTEEPFTKEQVEHVRRVASERFPLRVTLQTSGGQTKVFRFTSLSTPYGLAFALADEVGDTVQHIFDFFQYVIETKKMFVFQLAGKMRSIVEVINKRGQMPLYELGIRTDMVVFYIEEMGPSKYLQTLETMYAMTLRKRWPNFNIPRLIKQFKRQVAEDRRAQEFMLEEPIRIAVKINTKEAWDFGMIALDVPKTGTLAAIEPILRKRMAGFLALPDTRMKYIYGGILYSPNTRLTALPREEGDQLNVYIMF